MMLGNRAIIAALNKVKSHSDRGMFYPLQVAAAASLNGSTDFMPARNVRSRSAATSPWTR